MNPKVKKKWIAALRSRKYKQCSNKLCEIDEKGNKSYCCLGVLCNLYNPKLWDDTGRFLEAELELPYEVVKWAGLENEDPILTAETSLASEKSYSASQLNDIHGKKFYEIANYIERNL
jgi:hypothetical protein